MKNTKLIFLLAALAGVLTACGDKGGGDDPKPVDPVVDPCPEGEHVDANVDGVCDVCGYPVEIEHGVSVSGDPSAPFYLKVGEQKTITAKISPSPTREEEKTFKWTVNNKNIANFASTEEVTSAKNTIVGIAPGEAVFTATNDYNISLVRNFYANVINYDADNMYLWEYVSSDRAKFGYVNEDGKKAGIADGVATLGTIDWTFHRSATTSLQSNKGALGFGKGAEPETLVQLSAENTRKIKKIIIETASAKGLANITVKIGDNEVINKKTPSSSDDFIGSVNYIDDEVNPNKYSGNISIQYDTPEYDPVEAMANPETYQAPGAVYLKSILIEYYAYEFDWKTNKKFDMEAKFLAGSEDPDFNTLTTTAKEVIIDDEETGIQIKFNKLMTPAKDGSGIQGYALTNGDIEIICTKTDEVIKKVVFELQSGYTPATYTEYSSVTGGAPYTTLIDSVKGTRNTISTVGKLITDDHVNAVQFINDAEKTHYKVGVKSILVQTISGTHLEA